MLGDPLRARSVWIVVHGYGQLARFFLNAFERFATDHLIVAPEGLSRFYTDAAHQRVGATWMTREDRDHEIEDHVAYLDSLAATIRMETGARPLHVLGFSQGVATTARWLVHGGTRADHVVFWSGGIPPELEMDQLKTSFERSTLELVHGTRDPVVPEATLRSNEDRLTRCGLNVRTHVFPGGHVLDPVILARCFGEPGG